MERTILHADMNCFYASVEMSEDPSLRERPIAVVGDPERRHGIILTRNYQAKACGVSTGQAIWQALQQCPELVLVPTHFKKYEEYSARVREILLDYTSVVEPFGIDECWMDVTGSQALCGSGEKIAGEIRARVWEELGLTCSVGVSFNKVFAKLGSDYKKPDATTVITRENFRDVVWPLPVDDLLYVGRATKRKLFSHGIRTIGALAAASPAFLQQMMGVNGLMLSGFARGEDTSRVAEFGMTQPVKSIGNSTTAPRDLVTAQDVRITLRILCESVAERLRRHGMRGRCVTLSLRRTDLSWYERQQVCNYPICNAEDILAAAWELYLTRHDGEPLRSIGVRISSLSPASDPQLSYMEDEMRSLRREDLERTIDSIRSRFGHNAICRGLLMTDPNLSDLNPIEDQTIHPTAFLPTLHWDRAEA